MGPLRDRPRPRLTAATYKLSLALALSLRATVGNAQVSAPQASAPLLDEFIHESWDEADGLPGRRVNAVAQTRDGYLWLGTDEGLVRFDGVSFTTPASASIHGAVSCLAVDREGALWACASVGGLYRYRAGVVTAFRSCDGLPDDRVNAVHVDRDGRLWAGTERGLARRARNRFFPVGRHAEPIRSITEDPRGRIWVESNGTYALDGRSLVAHPLGSAPVRGAIHVDRAGAAWVGTAAGIERVGAQPRTFTARDGLDSTRPRAWLEDREGSLWVGTDGGVARLAGERFRSLGRCERLTDEHVSALFQDREGSVWVGTRDGLDRLRPRAIRTRGAHEDLPSRSITGLCEDPTRGVIWAGTERGGLVRVGRERTEVLRAPWIAGDDAVLGCVRTDDGVLRVITPAGVEVYPDGAPTERHRADVTFEHALTGAAVATPGGELWLGAEDGVLRVGPAGPTRAFTHRDGLPAGAVRALARTVEGTVWVGAHGLARIDGDQVLRANGLDAHDITDLRAGTQGLWIATRDRSLLLLRGEQALAPREGATEIPRAVIALAEDRQGRLWMATERGVVDVDANELVAWMEGREASLRARVHDRHDGLLGTDFSPLGAGASLVGADGRVWFASAKGVVEVDPPRLRGPDAVLDVHVERVEQGIGHDLAPAPRMELTEGRVEFYYTATSLLTPRRIRFRYRLEGVDGQWVYAGARRVAVYNHLTGGEYRFVVQAVARDGDAWDRHAATVRVGVVPSIYRQRRFQLVAFLGAVTALALFFIWRTRRLSDRASALQRLVDERTRALRASHEELEARVRERTARLSEELAERSSLEHQLQQSQKLESLGRLAGGVAHDLNNLMTAVLNYAEFAEEASGANTQLKEDIQGIREAAERATMLTRQLLTFARRQVVDPKVIDLSELTLNIDKLLRRLLGADVELVTIPDEGVWPVRADPNQIEQVLVNMAVNARDAMPRGGVLIIQTSNVTLTAEDVRGIADARPGDYVLLEVADSGTGMSDEVKEHLFEPFFTTKAKGEGTGLGLATCYGIVSQVGGFIVVESVENEGTRFKVHLPRAKEALSSTGGYATGRVVERGDETVLLVEDMPRVRQLAARTLRALGYTVLEAENGEEALRVAEREGERIDAVITDVVMPRMGGPELVERLHATRPDLKVLFVSGYTDTALSTRGVLQEGVALLRKPFTSQALARRIRKVLDGHHRADAG